MADCPPPTPTSARLWCDIKGSRWSVTLNFAAPIDPRAGHQVGIEIRTSTGGKPYVDKIFGPNQHDSWLYKNAGQEFQSSVQSDTEQ